MKRKMNQPYLLFLDIGGVLLTNGWDKHARAEAIQKFHLNSEEFDARHSLVFDVYEQGKISLDQYLDWVIFYQQRPFSKGDFKSFMFSCSKPYQSMLDSIKQLKQQYGLKIIAITNEGRELMDYRIESFQLKEIFDFFVCSGFVGMRKPAPQIYQLALDLSQATPETAIYVDDRLILIDVVKSFGWHTIHHTSLERTHQELESYLTSSR